MNKLVVIGMLGCKRVYVNMSVERAIRLYLDSEWKTELDEHDEIQQFEFEDEFCVYDVWVERERKA